MRRFFAGFLMAALLLPIAALADFSDLDQSHPHHRAITALVDQGILEGYGDGSFQPEQDVTRAETVKIVLLGAGFEVSESEELHFSDVAATDWHVNYIESAYRSGLIQGYTDGTFLPNQTVSRAEAAKIVLSSAELDYGTGSEWYTPYQDYAIEWNIAPKQSDGLWHPEALVSRGELAEMMFRFQEVLENGVAYDPTTTWSTVQFPTVDITLKVPAGWYSKQDGVGAVWRLDSENGQVSLLTPYENGATLLMTRYLNSEGASSSALFTEIAAQLPYESSVTTFNGRPALIVKRDEALYYREWYIYLENQRIVHLVALRGQGASSDDLELMLNDVVWSLSYASTGDSGMTTEEIVTSLRAAIQVDGVGMSKIDLLSDVELIETDTIGIGTGPVDYYYSPSANITIKYERSFDVILDIENGETSAF